MTDKETGNNETEEGHDSEQQGSAEGEPENKRPDDTLASDKKCPECGAPVDDVRATCIDCVYEYKDEDHEDPDAGSDFVAGTQVDDEGNEIPEDPPEDDVSTDASDDGKEEEG